MRRTVLGRAFATMLAAWFVFASQGAVLFSSCPMQSMDMSAGAAPSHSGAPGMAGMAMAHDAGAVPANAPTHPQPRDGRPPCCTSPACGCNGPSGPANASCLPAFRMLEAPRIAPPEYSYQPSWADHILPYPAAPPAAPSA